MNRKPYSQRKRTTAKSVLRLPHLRHAKSMRGCGRIDDNAEIIQMRTERISLGRGLQEPIFALGLPPDAWALSGARGRRPWLSHLLVHQLLEVAQRSNGLLIVKR